MLLLSIGPTMLVALLQSDHRELTGPDLSWLLYGPILDETENASQVNTVDG